MNSPFIENRAGLWNHWLTKIMMLVLVVLYVFALSKVELKIGLILLLFPVAFIIIGYLFLHPYETFITLFVYNYFAMGASRYIPGLWGLGSEILLVFLYASVINRCFAKKYSFAEAKNELTFIAVIWYIYTVLQLFNPEAYNAEAWFFGMRSVSLSFLLVVPIAFVLINKLGTINLFLKLWATFSIFAVVKGWSQLNIGLDWAEQRWMNEIGHQTHLIWSGLRVFSIFTDAGQYGASIGQSGVVFAIVAIGKKGGERAFFAVVALLSIYGMFMSGTRGAIAVPAAGFLFFLGLVKNWKLLIIGSVVLFSAFFVLKYTTIGSGNAQIVRMRTAFNPEDESLQVRLSNQAKLKSYLEDKPFGAGLGSTGSFGRQYYPTKYSSKVATDSWFVLIWVEMGIVGLSIHLLILFYCLLRGGWIIMTRVKDRELYFTMAGLLCGFCGIIVASYGNAILGQMPTCIITFISLVIIFNSKKFQDQIERSTRGE